MSNKIAFGQRPPWYRAVIAGAVILTTLMIASMALQLSDVFAWRFGSSANAAGNAKGDSRTWEEVLTFKQLDEVREIDVEVNDDITLVVDEKATAISVRKVARSGLNEPWFDATLEGSRLSVSGGCDMLLVNRAVACSISAEVTIPAKLTLNKVRLNSDVGSVIINNVTATNIDLHTDVGDLEARNLVGDVKASSDTGMVFVENVKGNLNGKTNTGTLEVSVVSGNVTSISDTGEVTVWGIGGKVNAKSDVGSVYVCDAKADIEAVSDTGEVIVRAPEDGEAVNLKQRSSLGESTIDAPTDPKSNISVTIRSEVGSVRYLPYDGNSCGSSGD